MREICAGLDHAHSKGVIHGDMKPQNVFLLFSNEVKVFDFALALARERMEKKVLLGSAHYSAPEYLLGKIANLDEKTDTYAVGCLFYTLLMLRLPLEGIGLGVERSCYRANRPFNKKLVVNHPKVEGLVYDMVSNSGAYRPTMAEVMQRIDEILWK